MAPQFPLKLRVNGRLVCTLTIDFQIILADGREELHEVKDHATREWILKEKIFQALYPDRTLIVVR